MNIEVKNQMESVMENELAEAIATLEKANRAFERLFGKVEGEGVGNCANCNAWDDSLEVGICQTCIKEEE